MLGVRKTIRSLGFGGLLCGGLTGLLFIIYPEPFPPNVTLDGLVLVGAFLGATVHCVISTIVKPVAYYLSLVELHLLRRQIGEATRTEITRELTTRYFLGDNFQSGGPRLDEKISQLGKHEGHGHKVLIASRSTKQ